MLPISYSLRDGQHHFNLRTYKETPRNRARWRLLALLLDTLQEHLPCIEAMTGAQPTHAIVVPSTRGRTGPHPLAAVIDTRLGMPWLDCGVSTSVESGSREFRADWFQPVLPRTDEPSHVLILDDTWTTGARAQSLAYAVKRAGAATVATVVLGRHVNPKHDGSKPLVAAIQGRTFDPGRCCIDEG